jgi:hypothetical protein
VVASWFADCTAYRFELVAAEVSGDLTYTGGFEHISVSFRGGPVAPISIRVTQIYRRENGESMIVHRHVTGFWTTRFDLRGINGCDGTNPTPRTRTRHHAERRQVEGPTFTDRTPGAVREDLFRS